MNFLEFCALYEKQIAEEKEYKIFLNNQLLALAELTKRKRRVVVDRQRLCGHEQLYNDYFAENRTYTDQKFRRNLFYRITEAVQENDSYFQQKNYATFKPRFSPIQKISAAIRQSAYRFLSDSFDKSLRIAETTVLECLRRFCTAIIAVFGEKCLCSPNEDNLKRILEFNKAREFSGILGLLDCMHW